MLRTKLPFFLAYARARQQPIFIEYIESDGVSWIDMQTLLNQNHEVSVTARIVPDGKTTILFGNILDIAKAFSCACGDVVANSRFSNAYYSGILFRTSERPVTYTVSKTGVTVDGEVLNWNTTPRDFQLTESAFLLGNRAIGIDYANNRPAAGTRIYGSQTRENGVLIQDLRPCLHPQTFEACMYDTVTKQYFYNKGLGKFIAGPIFVEYLESTGSQYINTNYIMTSDNQEVECEFQYTDQSGTQCLFGTLPGANRGITPYTNNDSNFYVHTGQPAILKFTNFDYSAKHSLYVKAVVGQGVYGKLDDTEQTTTTVLTTINKSNPYFLFARNNGVNNRADSSYFKGRISKYKMYDNGVLVRDMRPCINPSTGEACMYDMVTGTYFYNQGTGEFTAGGKSA